MVLDREAAVTTVVTCSASAEFYDLIYSIFKDYSSEAAQLADLLRS
jgi:hypothetical protein